MFIDIIKTFITSRKTFALLPFIILKSNVIPTFPVYGQAGLPTAATPTMEIITKLFYYNFFIITFIFLFIMTLLASALYLFTASAPEKKSSIDTPFSEIINSLEFHVGLRAQETAVSRVTSMPLLEVV